MSEWLVPVTITEHRRIARVEAETKAEAIAKARRSEWESITPDAEWYTIKIAGKVEQP